MSLALGKKYNDIDQPQDKTKNLIRELLLFETQINNSPTLDTPSIAWS